MVDLRASYNVLGFPNEISASQCQADLRGGSGPFDLCGHHAASQLWKP